MRLVGLFASCSSPPEIARASTLITSKDLAFRREDILYVHAGVGMALALKERCQPASVSLAVKSNLTSASHPHSFAVAGASSQRKLISFPIQIH